MSQTKAFWWFFERHRPEDFQFDVDDRDPFPLEHSSPSADLDLQQFKKLCRFFDICEQFLIDTVELKKHSSLLDVYEALHATPVMCVPQSMLIQFHLVPSYG